MRTSGLILNGVAAHVKKKRGPGYGEEPLGEMAWNLAAWEN
jgi:hypothetical protein